jgi:hypothetical protein
MRLRPDWAQAATIRRCQCSWRLPLRAADNLTIAFCDCRGTSAATPSSTAFSTVQSILSEALMHWARVKRKAGAGSVVSSRSTWTVPAAADRMFAAAP